jgi:hypothetical protein
VHSHRPSRSSADGQGRPLLDVADIFRAHGEDEEAVRAALRDELGFDPLALGPPPMPERARRLEWASLLERVFKEDILQCASCGGSRKVTAFIPSGPLAREIHERLGVGATGPPIAKSRARPHQEHFDLHPEDTAWIRSTRTEPTEAPVCGEAITRSQSPLLGLLSATGAV